MATHDKVTDDTDPGTVVVSETGKGRFQQEVISGAHRLLAARLTAILSLLSNDSEWISTSTAVHMDEDGR